MICDKCKNQFDKCSQTPKLVAGGIIPAATLVMLGDTNPELITPAKAAGET